VQSILQPPLPRPVTDKRLHGLQLFFTACLESAGVVENISLTIREDDFVLHIVQATLQAGSSISAVSNKNRPAQPLVMPRVESDHMMKSKALLAPRMTTYPLTLSPWTKPVDLWTLGSIANFLQDRGLPCICPSNNEDSEPEIVGDFGEDLLCIYSTSPTRQLALDLSHALITVMSREGRLAYTRGINDRSWIGCFRVGPWSNPASALFQLQAL